ncbi:minor capsid protein [Capybara microvirus Cap3_SP_416]|nr:minor capsid protein [Capybara microvirus Cap3_SP_416]
MSFLSSLISTAGSALKGATSLLPNFGLSILGNSLLGNSQWNYQKKSMQLQNDLALKNWQTQFNANSARQDYLNRTNVQTQANALQSAGFNPSLAMSGSSFSGNVASASPSAPSGTQSNFTNPLTDALQFANMDAQNQLTLAQARSIQIDNERKQSEDDRYREHFRQQMDAIDNDRNETYNMLPESIRDTPEAKAMLDGFVSAIKRFDYNHYNKGWFESSRDLEENSTQSDERKARRAAAALSKAVSDAKIKDPEVLGALKNMDLQTYNNLVKVAENVQSEIENRKKQGELLDAQSAHEIIKKEMSELEREEQKTFKLGPQIQKLLNGGFQVKDLPVLLLAIVAKFAKH